MSHTHRSLPTLKVVPVAYRSSDLEAWKDGKYDVVLGESHRWGPLENILAAKATRCRQGRIARGHDCGDARFFGEAVAAKSTREACRYSSYKWLTSPLWASQRKLPEGPKTGFRNALQDHFGQELSAVRATAMRLRRRLPLKSGRRQKPVAPDLWVITSDGSHRFIEVKLSDRRDTSSLPQLAGLAVIATCLGSAHAVSVELFNLFSHGNTPPDCQREKEQFAKFCQDLARTR